MELSGKTVFLTGAASGLGRELTLQLDRIGSRLLLVDRDVAGLDELVKSLSSPVQIFVCDLSQPIERNHLITELNNMAMRIDLLIHCAGIGSHSRLDQLTPEEVELVLQINTAAPISLTAGLLPLLTKDDVAGVVTIGSLAGELTTPSMSLYSASKSAIHAFGRAASVELGNQGHFNLLVILGALKNTNFTSSIQHPASGQPGWYRKLDADPADVAKAILKAVAREQAILFYPGWYRWIIFLSKLFTPITQMVARASFKRFRER